MPKLFTEFNYHGLALRNRIVMAPMCQYTVEAGDGKVAEWHKHHYISRAIGGVGLIIIEAAAVSPEGRISNRDLGLWEDSQIDGLAEIVEQVHRAGAKIGIQLAHAGRKAEDAAAPISPSPLSYPAEGYKTPREMSKDEIEETVGLFGDAARRAGKANFDMVEIHGAHGYLIHQFMSPKINRRKDAYGEMPWLFGEEVIKAVKCAYAQPVGMRLSAIEYQDGGYDLEYCKQMADHFTHAGVDLYHLSSGGEAPPGAMKPGNYPGYQVPFARAFKRAHCLPVIAVGLLDSPHLAEAVVANDDADLVALGRGLLRDPYWAFHAEESLTGVVNAPPEPYARGFNYKSR